MIALITSAYGHPPQPGRTRPVRPVHARTARQPGRSPATPAARGVGSPAVRPRRLAIAFVSGPGALASALRRSLLGAPLNTKSVPLDIGHSDSIPESIRRAVILRDKHCAWPGGCDRRPAVSDVHHITHKKDGGPTSVKDCSLLCKYHHDICIHRHGWTFELLPDGSTRATSPDGKLVLRSHRPPPTTQPSG